MIQGCMAGLGRMGITHFSILHPHPDVRFVGACEPNRLIAKNFEKYTGVPVFGRLEEMLDRAKPDFVIIATPSAFHSPAVQAAVSRGIHVFVEKPFCLDLGCGEEILKSMATAKLVNQVGYVNRFNEVFAEVKRLLQAGILGRLVYMKSEMYGPTVLKRAKAGGWRGEKNAGGGCLHEFASHAIDLVNYYFGAPRSVTGSLLPKVYSEHAEDAVMANFTYEDGRCAVVSVNWSDEAYRKPVNRVEIFGENGKLIADKHEYKVYLRGPRPEVGLPAGWTTKYITDFGGPVRFYVRGNEFTAQLDHFIASISDRSVPPMCDFASALTTDRMLADIARDAAQNMEG